MHCRMRLRQRALERPEPRGQQSEKEKHRLICTLTLAWRGALGERRPGMQARRSASASVAHLHETLGMARRSLSLLEKSMALHFRYRCQQWPAPLTRPLHRQLATPYLLLSKLVHLAALSNPSPTTALAPGYHSSNLSPTSPSIVRTSTQQPHLPVALPAVSSPPVFILGSAN